MTHLRLFILFPAAALLLNSCVVEVPNNGSTSGTASHLPANAQNYGQRLTAKKGLGTVTIHEGGRVLSSIRTASPNVEQTRWHAEQEQIVVKSRGNHGPATVQLFNSRSGRELGRVMAYDIRGGKPGWAHGMGE